MKAAWITLNACLISALFQLGAVNQLCAEDDLAFAINGKFYHELELVESIGDVVLISTREGPITIPWASLPQRIRTALAKSKAEIENPVFVSYADILVSPDKYTQKRIAMKGAFQSDDYDRKTFKIKQGDHSVEVFYKYLPERVVEAIIREKDYSDREITVSGTVQQYGNSNDYYVLAKSVKFAGEQGEDAKAQPTVQAAAQPPVGEPMIRASDLALFRKNPKAAQIRAIELYPELGVVDSPLNKEFVSRTKRYQAENKAFFAEPDWPVRLAKECADAISETPSAEVGKTTSAAHPADTQLKKPPIGRLGEIGVHILRVSGRILVVKPDGVAIYPWTNEPVEVLPNTPNPPVQEEQREPIFIAGAQAGAIEGQTIKGMLVYPAGTYKKGTRPFMQYATTPELAIELQAAK